MFHRLRRLIVTLFVADLCATQLALLLADVARRFVPLGQPLGNMLQSYLNPVIHLLSLIIFPVVFFALGVYDLRRDIRPVGEPGRMVQAITIATLVFSGTLYFSYRNVPRLLVVYFFALELALLAALRLLAWLGLRLLRQGGQPLSRVLLVGTGEAAAAVTEAVQSRLGDSAVIIGCVDDTATAGPARLPVLGKLADVPELLRTQNVDEVLLALPSEQYPATEKLVFDLLTQPVRVRLVPDYMRLVVVQSSVETLDGLPLIGLREPRISGLAGVVKRLFDFLGASALILCTWPLMLLIALLIKRDSPGPVIFKQKRVGENGRLFWIYKFRTMVRDAEARGPQVRYDAAGRPLYKHANDPRITPLGHFLRRSSLDELPQFFNVLKGEMSLVGPRPEMPLIAETYEPWQRQRFAVPPGLTGWWQVSGRSQLPMHLNTNLDLYYIRNYSLWLDLKILWMTPGTVLRRKGAY